VKFSYTEFYLHRTNIVENGARLYLTHE